MDKSDYLLKILKDIDNMPEEQLREYAKRIEINSQSYFYYWQDAMKEIEELKFQLFKSKQNDD